jgi:hypothetical protein
MEAYISGVSTRKIDELVAALGCENGISKSEVSRICQGLDTQVQAFLKRPLKSTATSHLPRCHMPARPGSGPTAGDLQSCDRGGWYHDQRSARGAVH